MNILHLTVEENGKELSQIDLGPDKGLSIGRGEDNDLVLKSKNVSMFHCKITGDGEFWSIQDLGSTNGVKINGKRIQEHKLVSGESVDLYPFNIKVAISLSGTDGEVEDKTVIDAVSDMAWDDKTIMSTVAIPGGTVAAGSGGAGAGGQQNKNFVVVKNGPAAGLSVPIHGQITVGRAEGCDLVLDDSFISREHLLITFQNGVCRFKNLADNNPVRLNGKETNEGVLKDGNILHLGNSELKMRLEGVNPFQRVRNISPKTRILLLAGIFVLMLGLFVVFLKGGDPPEQPPEKITEQATTTESAQEEEVVPESVSEADLLKDVSLENKRQRSLFLYQAKQFAKDGLLEKAANRLEASLEVVPDDQEAQELLFELRIQISQKEKKESDRAALVENARKQIEKDLLLVEESLQQQEYINSLALLETISAKQSEYPELKELFNKVETVFEKVKDAQVASAKLQEYKQKANEQEIAALQEIYKKGWQAYKGNNYPEARKHWEQVAASGHDVPERRQAIFYLEKLKKYLEDKTQSDYLKGLVSYNKKDYPGALQHWNHVLKIYPNHPDIKPKVDQFLSMQIEKARHLYQEGLVYEGINNIEQAVKNWKQVLHELPLENSKYNTKAKEKLAEYGQK